MKVSSSIQTVQEKIKQRYPKTYKETKKWALKIKKFEKNDEFNLKKVSVVEEEPTNQTDLDVDTVDWLMPFLS
ncbi:30506_t:CDS:2 [Gigaspora margarita]|uniref:30506_t:CDS:1 n=1 Tax=Gigaspora margarita TaxID=4874 RepID=A0ABN7UJ79_GIGMA|nr:30506_t:CDS:2 [Gigaspora margarita]